MMQARRDSNSISGKAGRVTEAGIADEEDSSLNSNSNSSASGSSQSDDDDMHDEALKVTRLPSRFTHDSGQILEAADADEMDEDIVASSTTSAPETSV